MMMMVMPTQPSLLIATQVTPSDAHRGYLGRPVDMWALGCVLFECMHRRPAFKAQEAFELEGLIRRANFGPLGEHRAAPHRA